MISWETILDGKIKYRVWDEGKRWKAWAETKNVAVWNCYGDTKEEALEVARCRMEESLKEECITKR